MRAFVTVRQIMLNPPIEHVTELQTEVKELKKYMDEVLTDQNDINEDTRTQLELKKELNDKLKYKRIKNKTNFISFRLWYPLTVNL